MRRTRQEIEPPERRRPGERALTLQRCYWPQVHNWIRASGKTYQAESIGNLLELIVAPDVAAAIIELLPASAVAQKGALIVTD